MNVNEVFDKFKSEIPTESIYEESTPHWGVHFIFGKYMIQTNPLKLDIHKTDTIKLSISYLIIESIDIINYGDLIGESVMIIKGESDTLKLYSNSLRIERWSDGKLVAYL